MVCHNSRHACPFCPDWGQGTRGRANWTPVQVAANARPGAGGHCLHPREVAPRHGRPRAIDLDRHQPDKPILTGGQIRSSARPSNAWQHRGMTQMLSSSSRCSHSTSMMSSGTKLCRICCRIPISSAFSSAGGLGSARPNSGRSGP
jgi:hypothetical protein